MVYLLSLLTWWSSWPRSRCWGFSRVPGVLMIVKPVALLKPLEILDLFVIVQCSENPLNGSWETRWGLNWLWTPHAHFVVVPGLKRLVLFWKISDWSLLCFLWKESTWIELILNLFHDGDRQWAKSWVSRHQRTFKHDDVKESGPRNGNLREI